MVKVLRIYQPRNELTELKIIRWFVDMKINKFLRLIKYKNSGTDYIEDVVFDNPCSILTKKNKFKKLESIVNNEENKSYRLCCEFQSLSKKNEKCLTS